jgi:hypothetical protein
MRAHSLNYFDSPVPAIYIIIYHYAVFVYYLLSARLSVYDIRPIQKALDD